MLERMWDKENIVPLLVGTQTCKTTLEIKYNGFSENCKSTYFSCVGGPFVYVLPLLVNE